jgi:hypothetical protein
MLSSAHIIVCGKHLLDNRLKEVAFLVAMATVKQLGRKTVDQSVQMRRCFLS